MAHGRSSSDEALADVTLVVGEDVPVGGDSHFEPMGLLEPAVIRLPNCFDAQSAVRVLQSRVQAALARRPVARKRARAGGGKARGRAGRYRGG